MKRPHVDRRQRRPAAAAGPENIGSTFLKQSLPRRRRAFAEWQESLSAVARFEPFLPIAWSGQSFIYQELDKLGKNIQ